MPALNDPPVSYDEAVLSNALVAQKNVILAMIAAAENGRTLESAAAQLRFARPVWEAVGYGYKAREVARRISVRASELLAAEREYLAGCRKNDKTRASTEVSINILNDLTLEA